MIDRRLVLTLAVLLVGAPCWGQESLAGTLFETALGAASEGRLEEAIALLEPVKDSSSSHPREMALLGALYVETDRPAEALEVLTPLTRGAEVDPAVLYNAGRSALAVGRLELAEGYLEQSLSLSPESPASRELGLLRGQQGRYLDAYTLLIPWARANPQDLEARLAGAVCGLQLKRLPVVEELIFDLPQDNPSVRMLWGRLLIEKGDPWGAIATLEPLIGASQPEMELDARRALAEAYTIAGKGDEAVKLLVGRVGQSPEATVELAEAQYQSGDLAGALATIEPLAEPILESRDRQDSEVLSSLAPEVLLFYGRVLSANMRHQEAIPALERAGLLDPDNKQVWKTLGQALAAVGRMDEAQQALARFRDMASQETRISTVVIEEGQRDPTGKEMRRGFGLLHSGQAPEALEVARQEARLAPEDPRPRLLEAMALLRLKRPEEALDSAQRAYAMNPDNADANYVRGIIRMTANDLKGAEADLRRALELAAGHTAAMSDLAILLISRGEEVEARQLLERVLELQPGDPVAVENLDRLGQN